MGRWTGPLSTTPHISRRRAGLILAVLLAHLLLMASPLHDAPMGQEPDDANATFRLSLNQPTVLTLDAASQHARDGHCVIEWTTTSQRMTSATPHAVAVISDNSGAESPFASPQIVRAIGPPAEGDPQAVLQVFRL